MSHPFGGSKRSRGPRLTSEIVADDSRLLGIVDELLLADKNYRRLTVRILEAQHRLQTLCDTDAWLAYLDVEQLVTERANVMLAAVARFAFQEGRRQQRQLRGSR